MATYSAEIKAGLPDDFSGRNKDATRWLLTMKAYFTLNQDIYKDDQTKTVVLLNKMSKGRGAIFAEGWCLKLVDDSIPKIEKTLEKLDNKFEEVFIPKDLQDQAQQTIYSLTMDQVRGDFDQFATAFHLAQACSGIKANNILVDALQQGVTNQLATMMTTTALPMGQERTGWKWKQWLDKAGEFY